MYQQIKTTIKHTFIYGFGNLSSKLVGLILLPIISRELTVSQFGILSILEISSQIIIGIFGFGLNYAFERWYYDKDFAFMQKSIFFTVLLFTTILAVFTSFFLLPILPYISKALFNSSGYVYVLKLMIISSGIELISIIPLSLLRMKEKSLAFSLNQISRFIILLIATVLFLVYYKRGLNGIYEARLIALLFSALLLIKIAWTYSECKFELKILRDMMAYRMPLVASTIAVFLLSFSDRFTLKFIGGLTEVGQYSFAYKIAGTVKMIVISSAWMSIMPTVYKKMNDVDNKRYYSKLMTYIAFATIIFVLATSLFSREITKILGKNPAYWSSYLLVPIISIAIVFETLQNVALIGLNILKKTVIISLIITGSAAINIILNIILVQSLDAYGAALSLFITQLLLFFVTLLISEKMYPVGYEIRKILLLVVLAAFFIGIGLISFLIFPLALSLVVRLALLLVFPFVLNLLNFYEPVEKQRIVEIFHKLIFYRKKNN